MLSNQDVKLQTFLATLPYHLQGTGLAWSQRCQDAQSNTFYLESMHHCSRLRLWAVTCAAFSAPRRWSVKLTPAQARRCTARLFEILDNFGQSLWKYLTAAPDYSRMPSSLGYCVFIAGCGFSQMPTFGTEQRRSKAWAYGMLCFLLLEDLAVQNPTLGSKVCAPFACRFKFASVANTAWLLQHKDLASRITHHDDVSLLLPRSALWELSLGLCGIDTPAQRARQHDMLACFEAPPPGHRVLMNVPFFDWTGDMDDQTCEGNHKSSIDPFFDLPATQTNFKVNTTTICPATGPQTSDSAFNGGNNVPGLARYQSFDQNLNMYSFLSEDFVSSMDCLFEGTPLDQLEEFNNA